MQLSLIVNEDWADNENLICLFYLWIKEAAAPKPAVAAKGAAQKKQESSSEDSSSDSEDEAPAKVC